MGRPHPKAPHDLLCAVWDNVATRPFFVFSDCKSKGIKGIGDAEDGLPCVLPATTSGKVQADVLALLKADAAKVKDPNPLVAALADGRFAYVYVTSHPGGSFVDERAIVMREEESKDFFGSVWEFYRALRESFCNDGG